MILERQLYWIDFEEFFRSIESNRMFLGDGKKSISSGTGHK
jgi:hypothetical protein